MQNAMGEAFAQYALAVKNCIAISSLTTQMITDLPVATGGYRAGGGIDSAGSVVRIRRMLLTPLAKIIAHIREIPVVTWRIP